MRFHHDGCHVFPRGLAPLTVTGDVGRYWEPNVWMFHDVSSPTDASHLRRQRTGGIQDTLRQDAYASHSETDETGEVPEGSSCVDHEQCSACDFDGARYEPSLLLEAIRQLGPQWRRLLLDAGDDLRLRPAPQTWSALEYAAHSRDVTALHVFGVEQALTIEEPQFPEIAGAELVERASASYASQDPGVVAMELEDQARKLADLAEASGPASWSRGITVGRSRSDVRFLLEHALHDSHHHLVDVNNGLAIVREGSC